VPPVFSNAAVISSYWASVIKKVIGSRNGFPCDFGSGWFCDRALRIGLLIHIIPTDQAVQVQQVQPRLCIIGAEDHAVDAGVFELP
jgi:hypothetical protein